MQKHSTLIDLIKLSKDADNCHHLLFQETADRIDKVVLVSGERGPTYDAMIIDNNLLSYIWEQLKPDLAFSIESSYMLLG